MADGFFVRPPIDQTSERLKLADLLYQANMARVQAETQRQMQMAQMVAQFGQSVGAGIEDYLTRQQRERALAIQAERESRLASAELADAEYRRQLLARQQRADVLQAEKSMVGEIPGGTEISPEAYGQLQYMKPSFTKEVTPVLESRPQTMSMLAGIVPQAPAMEADLMLTPPPPAPMAAETMAVTPTAVPTAPMERFIKTRTSVEQKAFDEEQRRIEKERRTFALMQRITDAKTPEERRSLIEYGIASGDLTGAASAILNQERKPGFEEQTLEMLTQANIKKGMPEAQARAAAIGQVADLKRAPEKPPAPEKMTSDQRIVDTYQALDAAGYGTAAAMMEYAFGLVGKASAEAKAKRYEMIVKSNRNNPEKAADQIAEDAYRTASTKIGSAAEREEYNAVVEGLNYIQKWKDALSKVPNTPQAQKLKQTYMSTGLTRKLAEDFANLFGQTTDPALKSLQTEFNDLAYNYRRGMSGAAFGVKEDEQYRNLNQDIKNDAPLNMALMEGMEARLSSKFNNFWNNIGGADAERYANRFRRQYARIGGRAIGGGGIPPRPRGQQ